MQGLGKPIIGMQFKGHQFVGVGNKVHYGKWKTFFEFLDDYIRKALGPEWGNAELKKPQEQRHPILQWYYVMTLYRNSVVTEPGKIHTAPMTGATAAYYSLAYNLYLLEHNVELQGRLLTRPACRSQSSNNCPQVPDRSDAQEFQNCRATTT